MKRVQIQKSVREILRKQYAIISRLLEHNVNKKTTKYETHAPILYKRIHPIASFPNKPRIPIHSSFQIMLAMTKHTSIMLFFACLKPSVYPTRFSEFCQSIKNYTNTLAQGYVEISSETNSVSLHNRGQFGLEFHQSCDQNIGKLEHSIRNRIGQQCNTFEIENVFDDLIQVLPTKSTDITSNVLCQVRTAIVEKCPKNLHKTLSIFSFDIALHSFHSDCLRDLQHVFETDIEFSYQMKLIGRWRFADILVGIYFIFLAIVANVIPICETARSTTCWIFIFFAYTSMCLWNIIIISTLIIISKFRTKPLTFYTFSEFSNWKFPNLGQQTTENGKFTHFQLKSQIPQLLFNDKPLSKFEYAVITLLEHSKIPSKISKNIQFSTHISKEAEVQHNITAESFMADNCFGENSSEIIWKQFASETENLKQIEKHFKNYDRTDICYRILVNLIYFSITWTFVHLVLTNFIPNI